MEGGRGAELMDGETSFPFIVFHREQQQMDRERGGRTRGLEEERRLHFMGYLNSSFTPGSTTGRPWPWPWQWQWPSSPSSPPSPPPPPPPPAIQTGR